MRPEHPVLRVAAQRLLADEVAGLLFGTGSDNSHYDAGKFFEGAVTARYHRERGAGEPVATGYQ
jgi:hypothetical protein